MGFRDLSGDLAGGLLYTKWPLDVRNLMYDLARPRPRLSDRAGVSLCKGYNIIDSMVEATFL